MKMREIINIVEGAVEETLLFRGDATKIDLFSFEKADSMALFGKGIYLTDSREVAADYTLKGSDEVIFTDDDAKGPRKLINLYIADLVKNLEPTEEEIEAIRTKWYNKAHSSYSAPDAMVYEQCRKGFVDEITAIEMKLFKEAKKRYAKQKPKTKIVKDTTGTYYLVKADKSEHISEFEIPEEYLTKCLHGDEPLTDEQLKMVKDFLYSVIKGTAYDGILDMRGLDNNFKTFDEWVNLYRTRGVSYAWQDRNVGGKHENPSLDTIRNGTHAGLHAFYTNNDAFIAVAQKKGYVGIVYHGGVRAGGGLANRGGGGIKHRAFVFWNDKELNTFRQE